jgi:hypothetical protein
VGEITVIVELQPQPAIEEEVTVVATTRTGRRLDDQPMRVEVLGREEIEEKMLMTPGDYRDDAQRDGRHAGAGDVALARRCDGPDSRNARPLYAGTVRRPAAVWASPLQERRTRIGTVGRSTIDRCPRRVSHTPKRSKRGASMLVPSANGALAEVT